MNRSNFAAAPMPRGGPGAATLRRLFSAWLGAVLVAAAGGAAAQPVDRGRLLYETHCIECHTTQMHWRAQRAASDWTSLRAQVTRWQASLQLQWTASEIDAVSGYLNDTIYRHPRSQAVGSAAPRAVAGP